jgi:hypothetical protein
MRSSRSLRLAAENSGHHAVGLEERDRGEGDAVGGGGPDHPAVGGHAPGRAVQDHHLAVQVLPGARPKSPCLSSPATSVEPS